VDQRTERQPRRSSPVDPKWPCARFIRGDLRRGENVGELLFKRALFAGDGRGFETGDISGQIEGFAKPQLEPQGKIVRSMLQRKSRVARQMRQAGLMCGAMLLLRGITIREPDVRRMAVHHLVHDAGGARIIGLRRQRILAVKHPVIRVGPFDPHPGIKAGDNPGLTKNGLGFIGFDLEPRINSVV
jgi:hypothetical protein